MVKKGKKRDKKIGQISIFIIIAIVIIVVIALIILLNRNTKPVEKINPEVTPIYDYIENCVKTTGENDIFYSGQTGGYFDTANNSDEFGIAYYYDNGNSYIPTKEEIEKQMGLYMDFMLPFCTQNFSDFSDFNIKTNAVTTSVDILKDKIVFNVNYPVNIKKGEKSYFFSEIKNIEIPVRLERMYTLANNITQYLIKYKGDTCVTCVYGDAKDLDLFVEMHDEDDNKSVVYTIRDEKSQILEGDYRFHFATK